MSMCDSVLIRDYLWVTTRECGITRYSFRTEWTKLCMRWHNSYLDFDDIYSGRTATEGEMPFVVLIEISGNCHC